MITDELKQIDKELRRQGLISDQPQSTNWPWPPEKKIVKRVLDNKELFVEHELDYMERNSKTAIKDDPYHSELDDEIIEKKIKRDYKKWSKENHKKKHGKGIIGDKIKRKKRFEPNWRFPSENVDFPSTREDKTIPMTAKFYPKNVSDIEKKALINNDD